MSPVAATLFQVFIRMGVWRVTKDGAHYGDYSARLHAVEAAEEAIAVILGKGGVAELSMLAPTRGAA